MEKIPLFYYIGEVTLPECKDFTPIFGLGKTRKKQKHSALVQINKHYGFEDGHVNKEVDGQFVPIRECTPEHMNAVRNFRYIERITVYILVFSDGSKKMFSKTEDLLDFVTQQQT